MPKRRAMSSKQASFVKCQWPADSALFAKLIGLEDNYKNDPHAKKM